MSFEVNKYENMIIAIWVFLGMYCTWKVLYVYIYFYYVSVNKYLFRSYICVDQMSFEVNRHENLLNIIIAIWVFFGMYCTTWKVLHIYMYM